MIRTTQIAALITGLWISGTADAQSNEPAPPAPQAVQAPPTSRPNYGWRQVPLEAMTKKMNLTPEQLDQVKAIDKDYTAKYEAMNTQATPEVQRAETGKLMAARDAAIKALLTGEQQAAYTRLTNPTGARAVTPAERVDEKVARPAKPAAPAAPEQQK